MSSASTVVSAGERALEKRLPMVRRVAFVASGVTMLVGFFMPWLKVGTLLTISGFGLVFASGDVVSVVSGASRFMLIVVPVLGVLLLVGGIAAFRITPWIAAGGAAAILGFGLIQVLELFITSTGAGMWLVVVSAILCLVLGLLSIGRSVGR